MAEPTGLGYQAIRELREQIDAQERAVRGAEQYVIDGGLHLANLRTRMVALRMESEPITDGSGQVSDVATEWGQPGFAEKAREWETDALRLSQAATAESLAAYQAARERGEDG